MDKQTSTKIVETLEYISLNTSDISTISIKLDEIIELLNQLLKEKES